MAPSSKQTASFEKELQKVAKWSAEDPKLYKLLMTVKENGKVTEVVPFNVGFRRIEIKQIDQLAKMESLIRFYCSTVNRSSSKGSISMNTTQKRVIM